MKFTPLNSIAAKSVCFEVEYEDDAEYNEIVKSIEGEMRIISEDEQSNSFTVVPITTDDGLDLKEKCHLFLLELTTKLNEGLTLASPTF